MEYYQEYYQTHHRGSTTRGVQLHQTRKMKRPLRSRQENSRSFDLKRKTKQATTRVRQAQRKSSPSSDDRPNRSEFLEDSCRKKKYEVLKPLVLFLLKSH
ncbi:hypothetical protein CsSME_00043186 [Camellia sinensis var. sinensis]